MASELMTKRYIYIQVIEATDVVRSSSSLCEPFVALKYNGSDLLGKKSTKRQQGVEWWETTFRFKVKNLDFDWFTVEVRDKSYHVIHSDWIGEIQLRVKAFADGAVYDSWYKLGKTCERQFEKKKEAHGYIHLAIQMLNNQTDRPFSDPDYKKKSFEDWVEAGMHSTGLYDSYEPTHEHLEEFSEKTYAHFELTFPTIEQAEHCVVKNASKILGQDHYTDADIAEFKKLNRVNCLHRGNFEIMKELGGKLYMVAIDGSESAKQAFYSVLKFMDHAKDTLFFVTVRERVVSPEFYNDRGGIILRHQVWRAAAGIICQYQDIMKAKYPNIDYTSVLPEADDARMILCALVRRYQVDVLVIGKHRPGELKHKSKHFRSFSRYCQGHAKCSVMTFGALTHQISPV